MAYIAKFGDKWRAQVAKNGVRKTAVWNTRAEAASWAAKVETEIAGGKLRPAARTLRFACDHYLKTVTPGKRDAELWETRRFAMFCAYFGDGMPLADMGSEAIGKLRDFRIAGGVLNGEKWEAVSGSTVNREFTLLRHMLKLAYKEWKWIQEYPFDGVRMPEENPSRKAVWRWQQIRRVLRAGQARGGKTGEVVKAFHIALRTSFRLKEALAAPGGFDAKRMTVTLPPNKVSDLPEIVPTTRHGRRILSKMPVFEVGENEASTLFSGLLRQLGIEGLQFKDSRATALTHMAKKMPMVTLQKYSRHKDIRKLTIYYRETAEEISARH
ncbi:MAG: hypothetical protein V4451_15955 [Pseudomonadota bacterium]